MNAAVIILIIFLILLVLVGIGVGLYFAFRKKEEPTPKTPTPPGTTPTPGVTGVRPPAQGQEFFIDYPGIIMSEVIGLDDPIFNPNPFGDAQTFEECKSYCGPGKEYNCDMLAWYVFEDRKICQLQIQTTYSSPGTTSSFNLLAKGSTGATGSWYSIPNKTLQQNTWLPGYPKENIETAAECRQLCKNATNLEQVVAVHDDTNRCWCAAPMPGDLNNWTESWLITDEYTLV